MKYRVVIVREVVARTGIEEILCVSTAQDTAEVAAESFAETQGGWKEIRVDEKPAWFRPWRTVKLMRIETWKVDDPWSDFYREDL